MVKCSEALQCSDDLGNKVSNINRRQYEVADYIFFRFCFFMNLYMVVFLFNTVICVFLLLCLCILIVY